MATMKEVSQAIRMGMDFRDLAPTLKEIRLICDHIVDLSRSRAEDIDFTTDGSTDDEVKEAQKNLKECLALLKQARSKVV